MILNSIYSDGKAGTRMDQSSYGSQNPSDSNPMESGQHQAEALQAQMWQWIKDDKLDVPSIPSAIAEAMRLANNPQAKISSIEGLIGKDQAVAGLLLKYANSSIYGAASQVSSIREAIVRLGQQELRSILYGLFMQARVFRSKQYEPLVNALWIHTMGCAVLSRRIAGYLGLDEESAFLAGLLHDVGQAALLNAVATMLPSNVRPSSHIVELAMEDIHAWAGRSVVRKWGLPDRIIDAVSSHHNFKQAQEDEELAAIVQVSDLLAYRYGFGIQAEELDLEKGVPSTDKPLQHYMTSARQVEIFTYSPVVALGLSQEFIAQIEDEIPLIRQELENPFVKQARKIEPKKKKQSPPLEEVYSAAKESGSGGTLRWVILGLILLALLAGGWFYLNP